MLTCSMQKKTRSTFDENEKQKIVELAIFSIECLIADE